jgi:hypothetical protein
MKLMTIEEIEMTTGMKYLSKLPDAVPAPAPLAKR